ncbi:MULTISPECIES: hypothetical protein [Ralstonia solanacearum species complex]|uniref:hypothetical protein n=1 Tax=Ralstonia solanacearum species complex TaxID=3116862 RepID=UPI0018D126C1|nr:MULTISPECIES: hypothetical protein [Ralstonia solanacearum species complex]MDN3368325.1 hypothetical protein [Ralstonia pseudosolanacearum]
MNQNISESPRNFVIAEAAQLRTLAEQEELRPNVAVIERFGMAHGDGSDKPSGQAPGPDATAGLLAQLLETQTAMLATLKAIEAKLPSASW